MIRNDKKFKTNQLILLYQKIGCSYFKRHYKREEMQSKKQVNNPQIPGFNIRKVNKKIAVLGKNSEQFNYFALNEQEKDLELNNYSCINNFVDSRKQKQLILDQSVNESIINSKVYSDLKKTYLNNKKKNAEHKKALEEQIQNKKKEKSQALHERQRLQSQKLKYIEAIKAMKQKLENLREANQRYREALSNRVTGQAEYISNLIMSMRFQAQYEHGIDPDQMTYEQLLQLEQKIGIVSRGVQPQLIQTMKKIQINQATEQKCTICFSNYEKGEIMTKIYNCKHQFHFECLESWLSKEKVCPVCKQEIQFQLS